MRVTDAAARLGVSVSTAHRLLGMLVYRDFAEQLPDRRYATGPVLGGEPCSRRRSRRCARWPCRTCARLVDAVGETANLMVLAGPDVRFVATVESDQVLRVGDRTGRTLPAHLSSGGKAVLAALGDEELAAVLEPLDEATVARVRAGAAHRPPPRFRRQRPGDGGGADRRRCRRPARGWVQRRRPLPGRTHRALLPGSAAGLGGRPAGDRRRHRPRPGSA